MRQINLFVLFILSLFLLACNPTPKIPAQRERTIDAIITVTDIGHYKTGNVYITYIIDGYTKYVVRSNGGDKNCLPSDKIYIGSRLELPIAINKSSEYPTGYIDPPKDLCLINSISKKLEENNDTYSR